jgi:hypothetical protein
MAYDPVRREIITFDSQTLKWDGTNWSRVPTATEPPARTYTAMVYDEARQQMVLFGGAGGPGNDTWIWDGASWSNRTEAVITASNTPPARSFHAMAYDSARQEVVLFGGYLGGNLGDTWIWNGLFWRQRTVSGPSARNAHAMSFDRNRQKTVLFAGGPGSQETWEWDGVNWVNRTEPVVTVANTPPAGYAAGMAYDPLRRRTVLFGGSSGTRETWEWDGTNWFNLSPAILTAANTPSARNYPRMVYDDTRRAVVLVGGTGGLTETWSWDGISWRVLSGPTFYFDMSARPNGVWNYSTIDVASGVTVKFLNDFGNPPVRWLATGDVFIGGIIDVSGEAAQATSFTSTPALGGPGGFAGGQGAIASDQSGSTTGSPGDGPGGGDPGTAGSPSGQDGRFAAAYGNRYLQPLIGGSGGGGGASSATSHGGSGGGGGGAILISSSRDITVSGQILANGGTRGSGYSYGGTGSGGAIFLKADRILGPGQLTARGSGTAETDGRIRLEAYYRQLAGATTPVSANSLPVLDQALTNNARLSIASIDGVPVPAAPGGSSLVPDVVFTNLNPISILVSASAIPDTTPVRLRVTTASSVILATNTLSGASTTFSVAVPPGIGTVQAFAEFPLGR